SVKCASKTMKGIFSQKNKQAGHQESKQDRNALNLEELMARPSKKEMKQLKFKCYLALLISNFILFTLTYPTENKPNIRKISAESGNIVLRLPLTLMLSLNLQQKTHVTLVDRMQRVHATNAWIWDDEVSNNNNRSLEDHQKFYSIEVQPSDAAQLLKNNLEENMLMAIPPIPLSQVKKEHPYVEMLL
ncbi:MAG: hypothetical protein AABY86_14300, partial [Bdellovibrionota bacterium]